MNSHDRRGDGVAARTVLRYGDGERLAARDLELLGDQVMSFGKRLPSSQVGAERRKLPRRLADRPAQIFLPNGQTFPCRVLNHARGTARLSLTSVLGISATFELQAAGVACEAQTIHRGVGTLVVRFK